VGNAFLGEGREREARRRLAGKFSEGMPSWGGDTREEGRPVCWGIRMRGEPPDKAGKGSKKEKQKLPKGEVGGQGWHS